MIIVNIREDEEFIKLGQALKAAGFVESGVEAKEVIIEIKDDNTSLDSKTLTAIKNSKKLFVINNYVDNMIKYTWTIDGKNIGDIKNIETHITLVYTYYLDVLQQFYFLNLKLILSFHSVL